MKRKLTAWMRLFRVVNLPTVPGDVLVGAACAIALGAPSSANAGAAEASRIVAASLAGVFLYMYGLADNDITGADKDTGRPIPDGDISVPAARIARAACWFGALAAGSWAKLPVEWWCVAMALLVSIALYNRTKSAIQMGLCRALNVLAGAAALAPRVIPADSSRWEALANRGTFAALAAAAVWLIYIAGVTWYSEGEDKDPERKSRVGFLVGAVVYLQLLALLVLSLVSPSVNPLLITGAVLLVSLRIMKRLLPNVSAS